MTAKRRRAHGEGSVYQRSDGVWTAAVDLGWIDGRRKRKVVYGSTERDAVAKRDELRRRLGLGVDLTARSRTVGEWLNEWMVEIKATDGTRGSTLRRYRQVIDVHLVPQLGRVRLDRLTARDVQRMVNVLQSRLSHGSVVKVHGVLRSALSTAERMDLVPRNVAKSVRVGGGSRAERRSLTVAEAKDLANAMAGDRFEPLFTVALATGLRRAELLGLRWSDVDLTGHVLWVRQTVQRLDGGLMVVPPKTHRSTRTLPLSELAVRAFERQRAAQDADREAADDLWEDHDLVFANTIGKPIEPRNVNRRFDRIRTAAGLDWLRLHDLRHAFATFLIDQGEELRTVMELLGHSTIRLTADTYGHVLPSRMRGAADAIDRAIGGMG